MNEAKFQILFNKWAIYHMHESFVFELKFTSNNCLPFSAVKKHQEENLFEANYGPWIFKIPDLGNRNPFDGFFAYKIPAYIVIMFYKRGEREFFMIPLHKWRYFVAVSTDAKSGKSIKKEEARLIGRTCKLFKVSIPS